MIKLPLEIIQLLWSSGSNKVEHLNGFATEFNEATREFGIRYSL